MIEILPETTKNPITLIGLRAGICWGSDTSDDKKNFQRGIECIKANHGRTLEFVNIEMVISGYSARVIREWYTHIGCLPTRLQESTRYVNCENFPFVVPRLSADQAAIYTDGMNQIRLIYKNLINAGVSREDAANILPLGMQTKIVDKRNLRNLAEMTGQRLCSRAYWEYRYLRKEIKSLNAELENRGKIFSQQINQREERIHELEKELKKNE